MAQPHKSKTYSTWQPRQRTLLVLAEQSADRKILPEVFGVPKHERSWTIYADNFLRVNRLQLEALSIEARLTANPAGIEMRLTPSSIIGAIPLHSPITHKIAAGIVVRPRFGWNDIGPLLSAIGWSASPQLLKYPLVPGSAREIPPWVLAGPIIRRISALLKEIRRGFRMHEEVRQIPRGQILWKRYCTTLMTRGMFHLLPCRFPELGPDLLLLSYLRWGLERVRISLSVFAPIDVIARQLLEFSDVILQDLRDVPSKVPDHRSFNQLRLQISMPSSVLREGLEALEWILDERGLGGLSETDGLSWRLTMQELFERWVECIGRQWARTFGGSVKTAKSGDARIPIHWQRSGTGSLTELAPDIVVHANNTSFILDAKYKGHFEELDDLRWRELGETLKVEHRHDFHQVLAYAALFDAPRIVSVLVYPMFLRTWQSLAKRGQTVTRAYFPGKIRQLEVALIGIPLQLPFGTRADELSKHWDVLRNPLTG